MEPERWSSSLHAFELLLAAVPSGAARGVDVGCGEGETTRRLRRRVTSAVGIDPDRPSVELARAHDDDIDYRVEALATADLEAASFDVVSAVGMLHHGDHADGLGHLVRLVRPGGLLIVVGLARSRSPRDLARDALDAVALRRHTFRRRPWETPAPKVWPPPLSYAEARRRSGGVLPDARFRRVPYFRYGLTWTAPSS